ncbi:DNA invertase Pin-like site-specific DNA recombinase [Flavobacterium aquaticum]|uniref:DNA invertase Pin-like site-specific DNA recombinase n=1 Tax=Flavobacterium aquaticum TaxID=1236486 RepID=A0A327YKU0_9FLAO|nr:recombinase family protein [Flavobacterium aquaticum]RAK21628.1 DNA invertase Pin-like site-specific DNA recombinase [Flavobacterium aquaticum]
MKKARYIRISTLNKGQKTDRQDAQTKSDELVFTDTISGSTPFAKRPAGIKLIEAIESGIVTYVSTSQLDRWGRSASDIQRTLDYFKEKGVTVKIDNLGIESLLPNGKVNPSFKMITDILANLAEMTKESILENQRQGIETAKAKGNVYKGRVKGTTEDVNDTLAKYPDAVKAIKKYPEGSLRELAKLSVSKDGKKVSMNTIKKLKAILDKKL